MEESWMTTLYDIGLGIQKIREAADSISITGSKNAYMIVYITEKCNELIQSINDTIHAIEEEGKERQQCTQGVCGEHMDIITGETGEMILCEDGDDIGEPDSGTVASD